VGMSWSEAWIFLFGLCVGLLFHFWKSYVGKTAEKSGEIDAVERKIDLVLGQQEKLTTATETIKREISDKSLEKQRHEDMKREIAVQVTAMFGTQLGIVNHLLFLTDPVQNLKAAQNVEMVKSRIQDQDRYQELYLGSLRRFWETKEAVSLVFSEKAAQQMSDVYTALTEVNGVVTKDGTAREDATKAFRARLKVEKDKVIQTLRAELGIKSQN
jgi:hypothetical protein